MASLLSNSILKVLCNNQCCLEFKKLNAFLRPSFLVDEQLLSRALLNDESFHVVDEKSTERALSPGALIIARTPLRVCKDPEKCARCEELHLCRYLVCGKCRFGCFHYNNGNGEHGSCKFQTTCTSLHVCHHFLCHDCKFGEGCKRAHNFDATATKLLNGRGLSPENIRNLQKIYKTKFLLTKKTEKPVPKEAEKVKQVKQISEKTEKKVEKQQSSSSVSEADRNEICLFFVRKGCSFKEKCIRVHHDLPYKWEILDIDGRTWKHFPNEEDVERAYCDPANDKSLGPLPVDFSLMQCGGKRIRRLSTASSFTKPPHFILTTEWLWYWKNEKGKWIEYGKGEDQKTTTITSKSLENIYLSEIESEIPFSVGGNNYVLHIKEMYQQNLKYKTIREVRRRPRFVSAQDVKRKSKSDAQEIISVEFPGHWDKTALPSFSYTTVSLSSSASDYNEITSLFKQTMSLSIIHSIKRVQNPSLWRVFHWQKEQMKERNGGREIDERYLFHGTDKSLIEAICEQNFDWRICGAHGSMYGKGSYFARDAKYSNKYVKSKGSPKMMFVALVLVGESTKGSSNFVRPPKKTSSQGFYDSCVDNTSNPTIFVIFEKYQIYPEYIIEYS